MTIINGIMIVLTAALVAVSIRSMLQRARLEEREYWRSAIFSIAKTFGLRLQGENDKWFFVNDEGIRVEMKDCNTEQEQLLLSIAIARNINAKAQVK